MNLTTSATLISDSTYYVWSGDSFTLTCKYSNPISMSSDPTVSWTAQDTSDASISISPDTSATAISPVSSFHDSTLWLRGLGVGRQKMKKGQVLLLLLLLY